MHVGVFQALPGRSRGLQGLQGPPGASRGLHRASRGSRPLGAKISERPEAGCLGELRGILGV